MSTITWLHLSDLHMNSSRIEYDREHVMYSLKKDLERFARAEPRPDLIFFTGDLAFGQTPEEDIDKQFDLAFQFLDEIRAVWNPEIPKNNIFLVPGNHDVRREFVTSAVTLFLDSATAAKNLALLMRKQDKQWEQIIERLRPYRDALSRHGYDHLLQNPMTFTFVHQRSIGSWNVQVSGLNTAWSCVRDREKSKLWFCGKWQVSEAAKSPKARFSVCLMHHPASWFREEEDIPALDRLIESTFTFLLHGHEHDEWVFSSGTHTRIAAAAGYGGEDAENGYNLTSFNPATGEAIVRLRQYDKKGRQWIQNIIGGKTDEWGQWHLSGLGSQETLAPNGTRPISAALATANNKVWDAFVAVPMAALSPNEYKKQRRNLKKVVDTLRRDWGPLRIYYPAEHISGPDKWDPADIALVRGLRAISNSRIFIMIYTSEKPSSILVEAGFALAQGIPSLYFVKAGLNLPFLLHAASQAASDVKVYQYTHTSEIGRILKEYRPELVEFMRARDSVLASSKVK